MKSDTQLIHLGRGPKRAEGTVNLPVYRASTIVSPDIDSYLERFDDDKVYTNITYGAGGTHNARALAEVVAAWEGGAGTVVTGSGLSAITVTLGALLGSGDHLLITDSAYGPTRSFCQTVLKRYGVETTFYDPGVGAGIESLIRDNTALIFMEAPGSLTFEMQDVPAITRVAAERGVLTAIDNTWATPLYFNPLGAGVDVSIQAGTKYVAGHSDVIIGLVTAATQQNYRRLRDHARTLGDVAGPDDCYLALRGLRTLSVRLPKQFDSALKVARWLAAQPFVDNVLFPPLDADPGHELWKRDFGGGASLFGLSLVSTDEEQVKHAVNRLKLFQIGSSWGGYDSLVAMNRMPVERSVHPWTHKPFMLRLHIGLEDADDLIDDLSGAFQTRETR